MLEYIPIGYAALHKEPLPAGFNWISVLKDLASGAPCTLEDRVKLYNLSNYWTCCACGQFCEALPRNTDGSPQDGMLHALGYRFTNDIRAQRWSDALATIHRIEARTIELLDVSQDT